jgi:uncharacterized membrane protein
VSHHLTALSPPAYRLASGITGTVKGGEFSSVHWLLRRNCSLKPSQLGLIFATLGIASLSIATFFWMQGAWLVMPFAGLELLALGTAFAVYARHAGDGEKIVLTDRELVVELENAGRTQRSAFNREWVRIEPESSDGSLIQVSGQGCSVQVGRHLRPELRPALAREIRFALRSCPPGPG